MRTGVVVVTTWLWSQTVVCVASVMFRSRSHLVGFARVLELRQHIVGLIIDPFYVNRLVYTVSQCFTTLLETLLELLERNVVIKLLVSVQRHPIDSTLWLAFIHEGPGPDLPATSLESCIEVFSSVAFVVLRCRTCLISFVVILLELRDHILDLIIDPLSIISLLITTVLHLAVTLLESFFETFERYLVIEFIVSILRHNFRERKRASGARTIEKVDYCLLGATSSMCNEPGPSASRHHSNIRMYLWGAERIAVEGLVFGKS